MTKHIISEKLKTNLSSIASIPESNVTTTLDDAYHTKISGGQNTAIKMNDSFSDIAAKILNLISLNKADRKHQSKLIESDPEEVPQEKYSKIEDSGSDSMETKTDELNTENIILGYESWRLYRYWKMLKSGDTLTKLVSWFSRIGKKIFDFKWIKDIATYGLDIIKGALKLSEVALKFVPSARTVSTIGGIGASVLGLNDAIAGSESGGNYNAIFGHTKGDEDIQKQYGKQLSELTVAEVQKISNQRKGANAGAVGKYQFMPSTLSGLVDKSGIDPNTTLFNADTQEILQNILLSENIAALTKKGIEASPVNLKMAHYIGPQGTIDLYKDLAEGKNITVAESMAQHHHSVGSKNKELHTIKIQDFSAVLSGRMGGYTPQKETATPVNPNVQWKTEPVETSKGADLDKSSKDRPYITNNGTKVYIQPIIQQTNTQTEGANYSTPTSDHRPNMLDND